MTKISGISQQQQPQFGARGKLTKAAATSLLAGAAAAGKGVRALGEGVFQVGKQQVQIPTAMAADATLSANTSYLARLAGTGKLNTVV